MMDDDNIFWKRQLWRSSGPRQNSRVFSWFWDTKQGFLYKLHFFRYDFRGVQKKHQHLKSNLNDLNAILHPRYPKKIDHTNASKLKATAMKKMCPSKAEPLRTFEAHIAGESLKGFSTKVSLQQVERETLWSLCKTNTYKNQPFKKIQQTVHKQVDTLATLICFVGDQLQEVKSLEQN